MNKIIQKTVFYDGEIYSSNAIFMAISAYRRICSIIPKTKKDGIICAFRADRNRIDLIIHEFDNYLIELLSKGSVS